MVCERSYRRTTVFALIGLILLCGCIGQNAKHTPKPAPTSAAPTTTAPATAIQPTSTTIQPSTTTTKTPPTTNEGVKSPSDIYSQARDAVVYIENNCSGYLVFPDFGIQHQYDPSEDSATIFVSPVEGKLLRLQEWVASTASGFVYDPSGKLITNAHVILCDPDEVSDLVLEDLYYAKGSEDPEIISHLEGIENTQVNITRISRDMLKQIKGKHQTELTEEIISFAVADALLDYVYQNAYMPTAVGGDIIASTLIDGKTVVYRASTIKAGKPYPGEDVAVLQMNASNLPALPLKKTTDPKAGEEVYVIGYPAVAEISEETRLEPSITRGIISAFKKSNEGVEYIQIDAAASLGNSGAPVINKNGEVVGVLTAVSIGDQGFNFILPYKLLKPYLS